MWNIGASIAACRSSPKTVWARKNSNDHWSCWSPPGVPNASTVPSSCTAIEGDKVVRGRLPPTSDDGSPSSSQNICARVPRQNPSPGIAGELCSQPPDGVAETRLPQRSATSRWQVSPRVGSPVPANLKGTVPFRFGRRPSRPGRSSPEDSGPISARREAAYSRESSVSKGTGAESPYQASRSANASFAPSSTVWTWSIPRNSPRSTPSSSASCCRKTGPWPQGPVLKTVQPPNESDAGSSIVAANPARSSAVRKPAGSDSASQPRYQASRAASMRASRVAPGEAASRE